MITQPSYPLRGKRVVIVGGSSGIGLAAAKAAKCEGAEVTIIGRSEERLRTAAAQLGGAQTFAADVADRSSIESAIHAIGKFDHLVLTAGGIHAGLLAETDPEQLLIELTEHVAGSLYAVKAAVEHIQDTGSIVLMGGQFSDRPMGNGTSLMAMACRGIEALARSLALELKPLRVNVIAPGFVDTPLYDAFGAEGRAEVLSKAASAIPVGRVGRPEEVGHAIVFLLTNGYMNCEVLHIDGGGRFV
ncbi:SDR family oxidoreductase [Stappia sp.]|jgi:NAD(P)-dependent dehydrogenase (short-subunit alcohol dehydrogenase family)|uniref:SDR family oxidoreductase n=1 Tax=Stappia sp. TaxID=1870903 RepID=UPI003D123A64